MRKNRKRSKKMSVMRSHSVHVCAVIMMLFVMVIVNLLASSSCDQLMKSIGEKERQLLKLEDEYVRESARWEGMLTAKNIERALAGRGMAMHTPRAAQIIRMGADGQPMPGQFSVARAEQRAKTRMTAYNSRAR